MIRWRKRIRRLTYALSDVLCIIISFTMAIMIYERIIGEIYILVPLEFIGLMTVISFYYLMINYFFQIYESTIENFGMLTPRISSQMGFAYSLVIILSGFTLMIFQSEVKFTLMVIFFSVLYVLVIIERMIIRGITFKSMEKNLSIRNILVVGQSLKGVQYINEIKKHDYLNLNIVGYINVKEPNVYEAIPHLGGLDDMENIIKELVIDEIAVARPLHYDYRLLGLLDKCQEMGITVTMLLDTRNSNLTKTQVAMVGNLPVLKFHSVSLNETQLFAKRALDIIGAIVGMILFGIAYIIFAPIIKLESPGPVLFKQKRVGKNRRVFEIWKFRSMGVDAESRKVALMSDNEMHGHMFKMTNDPRVTRIGHFIRKTSIDELPQFYNVLKGDMSLVGTRPPTLDEVENYESRHHKRISITPGITGKWQISGRSDIEEFEEIVRLDNEYIADWNVRQDVIILFKTLFVVFKRRGSK